MAFVILTLPLLSIAKGIGYGNTKWDMNPSEVVAAQGNGAHLISSEKYKDNFGKCGLIMYRSAAVFILLHSFLIALIVLYKRT